MWSILGLVVEQRGEILAERIDTTGGPPEESMVVEDGGDRKERERGGVATIVGQGIPIGDVSLQGRPGRQRRALPVRRIGD